MGLKSAGSSQVPVIRVPTCGLDNLSTNGGIAEKHKKNVAKRQGVPSKQTKKNGFACCYVRTNTAVPSACRRSARRRPQQKNEESDIKMNVNGLIHIKNQQ